MKALIIFASSFLFAITQVVTADDVVVPNKPATQRVVHPPARVHTPNPHSPAGVRAGIVNTGRNQPARHANRNVPRNSGPAVVRLNQRPAFSQPVQGMPVAMTTQIAGRNYQTRQTPEQLEQRQKVSVTTEAPQTANNHRQNSNRQSYFDALKHCQHERHDCNWWKQHCTTIVFVRTGYYYLDAGYWYPALGYDPAYNYYDYDGPIYTYGNLLPDQVIANVQKALQRAGYYVGPVNGSLGPGTRAALANYQRDYGLVITGAIDEPTVQSLGLN